MKCHLPAGKPSCSLVDIPRCSLEYSSCLIKSPFRPLFSGQNSVKKHVSDTWVCDRLASQEVTFKTAALDAVSKATFYIVVVPAELLESVWNREFLRWRYCHAADGSPSWDWTLYKKWLARSLLLFSFLSHIRTIPSISFKLFSQCYSNKYKDSKIHINTCACQVNKAVKASFSSSDPCW